MEHSVKQDFPRRDRQFFQKDYFSFLETMYKPNTKINNKIPTTLVSALLFIVKFKIVRMNKQMEPISGNFSFNIKK